MSATLTGYAYLIAGVCFIMALRGLSSPESARQGNIYGIVGMVIAVLTTLLNPQVVSYSGIIIGVLIGGIVWDATVHRSGLFDFHTAFRLCGLFALAAMLAFRFSSAYGASEKTLAAEANIV